MEYKLIRSHRKTLGIQIKNGEIVIRAPILMSKNKIDQLVASKKEWIEKNLKKHAEYKQKAACTKPLSDSEINELKVKAKAVLTEKAEHFASVMGVEYKNITVRCQKTRWGSCSSKGNLNFNCLLMLFDDSIIDYVVVHELMHLKQMNHSALFWAGVEAVLPDYKERRKHLKEHEKTILLK